MVDPRTIDPPFGARFVFAVDGVEIGAFTEVTGLEVRMATVTVEEGGRNSGPVQLPGPVTWPSIVLKRGLTDDDALFRWMSECSGEGLDGRGHRLTKPSGSITLLDARYRPFRTWNFREAMPVRWRGPQFGTDTAALTSEELEVSHGGFVAE